MAMFVMAGGGSGGHVFPGLAVARELSSRGHSVRFIGTELASGPDITTRSAGLGGQLGGLVAGVTDSAGHIATVAISAPILVVDPQSREALSDNLRSVVPGANEEPASDLTDADELGPVVAPRRAKLNPAKPSVN